uniref:uncharacterized protein LOC124059985 n=1 Tax=Scatophagus argus TaxID=75038 RepID=UPI001ED81011|nr:uncharacterized protein LOC124059985 [Scatophagus argus]
MWHDSDAAESLSDTEDGFNARQLRMKAISMAEEDVEENDSTEEETDDEDLLVLSETEHRSTLPSKKSETSREVIKEVHSNMSVQFKTESSDSDDEDENVPLSELREKTKRKSNFTVKSPSKCFVSSTALPDTIIDSYLKSLNLVRVSPLRQKKTSHTKMCDGVQEDVPLVEVGQSQDSEIPPEDTPLKEAPAKQLPSHCVVQNTEQDKPTRVYQQLLPVDDPDEIQVVAETQMSQ